jgi:uncharacterized membrane-anchored protein
VNENTQSLYGFTEHPARAIALGELHARPALLLPESALALRYVFTFDEAYANSDHLLIAKLCKENGVEPPEAGARALQFNSGPVEIRWERHNEFVTYTLILSEAADQSVLDPIRDILITGQPGPLAACLRLFVRRLPVEAPLSATGGYACASLISQGRATLETNFTVNAQGMLDLVLSCRGLSGVETGALAQWALEFEQYRMLALIALPIARRVGSVVRDTEIQLASVTRKLAGQWIGDSTEAIYLELTDLAGKIEAEITASTYRFAAAQAYGAIVADRLARLDEQSLDERPTVGSFLSARFSPALRTYESMQAALQDLARRTARAADLIRTHIDLQLSRQNNDLLQALNRRTRQQIRLQQTVEGLSVAAVSYYVLGLIGYLLKGIKDAGYMTLDPSILTAAFVPIVVLALALAVRRIRKNHIS